MASCGFGGSDYLRLRCIFVPHTDIVKNTLLKQKRILEHEADLIHQLCKRNLTDVHTTNFDTSLGHVIKPGDQAGYGAFAAS